MKRESGYYWVREKCTGWIIAFWSKSFNEWGLIENETTVDDDFFEEIDENQIKR